jgi:hypothetical protein
VYLISPQLASGIQPTGRNGTKRKPKKHMWTELQFVRNRYMLMCAYLISRMLIEHQSLQVRRGRRLGSRGQPDGVGRGRRRVVARQCEWECADLAHRRASELLDLTSFLAGESCGGLSGLRPFGYLGVETSRQGRRRRPPWSGPMASRRRHEMDRSVNSIRPKWICRRSPSPRPFTPIQLGY